VIIDVLSEGNALGFSGTNAGGRLFVVDSEWRHNMAGIAPNSLDSEEDPPQRGITIAGNWVHDNDDVDAPAKAHPYTLFGIGIVVNGGRDDVVTQNLVDGHPNFGIAVLPSPDDNLWLSAGNEVRDNVVRGSGEADLVLGWPAEGGDCFSGNEFSTSLPVAIEWTHGCSSWLRAAPGGSIGAEMGPVMRLLDTRDGDFDVGDWRSQPAPPPQPQMPSAETAPPAPAMAGLSVPQPIRIRDARTLDVHASSDVSREVTLLGLPVAASWLEVLIGLYAYALPLILYAAWISIAVWDLVRQEAVPNRVRIAWMALVIIVPLAGPVAYYAFGRSPIQRSLRVALVVGGLGVYVAITGLAVLLGS
jgi:hypothetical protein